MSPEQTSVDAISFTEREYCRCGRIAALLPTYGGAAVYPGQVLPYCRACEYGPVATCDCAPETAAHQGAM